LHELKAKTLFSTHYHQLTEIDLPRIKNYHLDIIENNDGSINFIRKLQPGSTDKSYGIHVAKLAGIPDDVIIRAFEILDQIEEKDPFKATVKENGNGLVHGKYHNKILQEKKIALDRVNSDLEVKKQELNRFEEELIKVKKALIEKSFEVEKKINSQTSSNTISQSSNTKEKKYVQTTFFKPTIVKETVDDESLRDLVDVITDIDINSLTPIEAMKKLIIIKEKLSNINK